MVKKAKAAASRAGATVSPFGYVDGGNIARLRDQQYVQLHVERLKKAASIAEKQRLLGEIAFYPKHAKWTESKAYVAVHKDMVVRKDLPCLVCGVRNSTLNDPKKNVYGAKQMETHHHVIEWALANAIDAKRFNAILRPNLAYRHPDNPVYRSDMSEQDIKDWVDHSPDNLWVLCDVHHRAKYFGIHESTYPIWRSMDFLKPDFEDYVHKEISARGTADKSTKKNGARKKRR